MTSRPLFILAAIFFGVGLALEILSIDRFTQTFLMAGLLLLAVGHAA
jgi:hypothetical protein